MENSKKGYCISCGAKIQFNSENPYCALCGGGCSACNRFSSTESVTLYCHACGDPVYVSEKEPICSECLIFMQKI
ncbi:MAG: hypothetical protein ACTSVZ_14025 [Promethearchaeota archaeon]